MSHTTLSARDEIAGLMAEAQRDAEAANPLRPVLSQACARLIASDAALRQLVAQRIERGLLSELYAREAIGIGQVSISHDGSLWEPEGPDRRLLLAVCEQGVPVDVVALSSTNENEWSLLTGLCPVLGWDAWLRASLGLTDRLPVWSTPMQWLRAGGIGICVLQWDANALGMLRGLGEGARLLVQPEAKDRLRGLLAYGGLPRIEAATAPMQGRIAA